jgi:hypothetical protein
MALDTAEEILLNELSVEETQTLRNLIGKILATSRAVAAPAN